MKSRTVKKNKDNFSNKKITGINGQQQTSATESVDSDH